MPAKCPQRQKVAPLAGAWIETRFTRDVEKVRFVAPLAGAWIETDAASSEPGASLVAPLAGAWIETNDHVSRRVGLRSRPSRARGLKLIATCGFIAFRSRAPRGRVD